jgi:hypothetical protein
MGFLGNAVFGLDSATQSYMLKKKHGIVSWLVKTPACEMS